MPKYDWRVKTVEADQLEATLTSLEDEDFEVHGIHPLPGDGKVAFAVIGKRRRKDERPLF